MRDGWEKKNRSRGESGGWTVGYERNVGHGEDADGKVYKSGLERRRTSQTRRMKRRMSTEKKKESERSKEVGGGESSWERGEVISTRVDGGDAGARAAGARACLGNLRVLPKRGGVYAGEALCSRGAWPSAYCGAAIFRMDASITETFRPTCIPRRLAGAPSCTAPACSCLRLQTCKTVTQNGNRLPAAFSRSFHDDDRHSRPQPIRNLAINSRHVYHKNRDCRSR